MMAAPTAIAPLRPNLTVVRGPGRPSEDMDALEVRLHDEEVADFVRRARPLLRRLEVVGIEVGPAAWQTAVALTRLVDRLERQWTDPGRAA